MKTLFECWGLVKEELEERARRAEKPSDILCFKSVILRIVGEVMQETERVDPAVLAMGIQIGMEVMAKYKEQEVRL